MPKKIIQTQGPKVLKWAIAVFFFILGAYLFFLTEAGRDWSLLPGLFCFGVVYWIYGLHSSMPRETFLISGVILTVGWFAAAYLSVFPFYPFTAGFFEAWAGWSYLIGTPVIFWAFQRYG